MIKISEINEFAKESPGGVGCGLLGVAAVLTYIAIDCARPDSVIDYALKLPPEVSRVRGHANALTDPNLGLKSISDMTFYLDGKLGDSFKVTIVNQKHIYNRKTKHQLFILFHE